MKRFELGTKVMVTNLEQYGSGTIETIKVVTKPSNKTPGVWIYANLYTVRFHDNTRTEQFRNRLKEIK